MGGRPSPRRSKSKHRKHESKKSTSSSTSKSKSPHRTTPLTLPRSLSNDERKHGAQLESLLHSERLRADDAVSRAEYAERREKEALAAVQRLEETKLKLQEELWAVESASRDYQVQLELTERELRVSQRDGELLQHETKLLDRTCRETQEKCRQYQASFRKYEERMSTQETEMQNSMQKWFISGEGQGYEVGYSEGYREGRVDGKQHGIRLGRKEGLREGRESGRTEERRNAMEAMDRFLAQQSHGVSCRVPPEILMWCTDVVASFTGQ